MRRKKYRADRHLGGSSLGGANFASHCAIFEIENDLANFHSCSETLFKREGKVQLRHTGTLLVVSVLSPNLGLASESRALTRVLRRMYETGAANTQILLLPARPRYACRHRAEAVKF